MHYVLLALGVGLQLFVVMGCLALTGRFAEFMDLRVQKQQLLNKDLRRAAVRMIGDTELRSAEDDRATIQKFEKVLRQQYVIETCEAGAPAPRQHAPDPTDHAPDRAGQPASGVRCGLDQGWIRVGGLDQGWIRAGSGLDQGWIRAGSARACDSIRPQRPPRAPRRRGVRVRACRC